MATPRQAQAAYERRMIRVTSRIEYYDEQILAGLDMEFRQRMEVAGQLLRDQVVANISLPVERAKDGTVTVRSLPFEFPRTETGRLMKDIFYDIKAKPGRKSATNIRLVVATSLDYGLILELFRERSFLRRTLVENLQPLQRILGREMTDWPDYAAVRSR